MFILKIILGLILAIAVGAIFTDNMGDGYFDFQKKAKAEAFTNKVDDIAAVMQTYKISQPDTVSLYEQLERDAVKDTTMNQAVTDLTSEDVKLLKGDAQVELGELALGEHTFNNQDGVYLVLVSDDADADAKVISDEICQKINENITGELDLSTVDPTAGDTAYDASALFTAIGTHEVEGGQVQGACFTDTVGERNAFVYYVQEK